MAKEQERYLESRDVRELSSEAVPAQLPCSDCSRALKEDPAGALHNLLPCWRETPLHPLHPDLCILVPPKRNLGAQTRGQLQCSPARNLSSMMGGLYLLGIEYHNQTTRVWMWGGYSWAPLHSDL